MYSQHASFPSLCYLAGPASKMSNPPSIGIGWLPSQRNGAALSYDFVSTGVMGQETSSSCSGTMVASAIVTALASICVALRFYTQTRTKAGIAWDDWWILIGLLTSLLIGGLLLWGKAPLNPKSPFSTDDLSQQYRSRCPERS